MVLNEQGASFAERQLRLGRFVDGIDAIFVGRIRMPL
jgi:hypothetical protein